MSTMIKAGVCTLAATVVCLSGIAQASPVNLITNGGFESGNTGFSTSLIHTPYAANVLTNPGTYGIYDSGAGYTDWHSSWNEPAPSEGSKYMIINAAAEVNKVLQPVGYQYDWQQTVNNLAAGEYEFLFDAVTIYKPVTSLNTTVVGDITFTYVNVTITTPLPGSGNGPSTWQTYSDTFYLPSTQNVVFTIKNTSLAYNGDDYGLDNIRLYAIPVPAAAWAGMSMLGAMGAFRMVRRRREQASLV